VTTVMNPRVSKDMWRDYWLEEHVFAFKEGLCSMESVSQSS